MSNEYTSKHWTVDLDPEHFLIPVRSGATVYMEHDGDQAMVLLALQAETYSKPEQGQHEHIFALNETMVCGIVTQLLGAMNEAGVPMDKQLELLHSALTTLDVAKRHN